MLAFPRILILILLISFASISAVLFTPALPGLARDFAVSEEVAQWTMSLFLVGYSIGQLPYGPLANRWGRKKAIYIGVAVAILGSLLCLIADRFWVLCLGRFLQALGSAVGLKITFTMISDQHVGPSATRALSLVMLAFGIMPGLGVAIGGFLTVSWGWKGCFVFLAIYSFLLGLLTLFLPETAQTIDSKALNISRIARGYANQFKDLFLIRHAALTGLTSALLYIFATISPYLGIETIGLTPDQFGLWSIIPSLGLFFGVLITRKLAHRQSASGAILSGILFALLGTFVMGVAFCFGYIQSWALFGSMFLIQIGDALIYTNAATHAVSHSTDKSNASAVLQFVTMSIATLGIFITGFFSPNYFLLIPISFLFISVIMTLIWLKLYINTN